VKIKKYSLQLKYSLTTSKKENNISRIEHFDPMIGLLLLRCEKVNAMALVPKTFQYLESC